MIVEKELEIGKTYTIANGVNIIPLCKLRSGRALFLWQPPYGTITPFVSWYYGFDSRGKIDVSHGTYYFSLQKAVIAEELIDDKIYK